LARKGKNSNRRSNNLVNSRRHRWRDHAYNHFVLQDHINRVPQTLENTLQDVKLAAAPDEKKPLLPEMRGLIEEGDRLVEESLH
jgi:hypothetical protein